MKSDNLIEATIKALTESKSLVKKQANTNQLKENKKVEVKKVDTSNGIPDEMYEIADKISDSIKDKDFLSRDDFEDLMFKNAQKVLDVKTYEEMIEEFPNIDNDIRGILSYKGWDTDFVEGNLSTNPEKYFDLEENKKVEAKKVNTSNGISNEMYEIADKIDDSIKDKDFLSRDDFEDLLFKNAQQILNVTTYDEMIEEFPNIDSEIRGILSNRGWATDFNEGNLSTNPEKYFELDESKSVQEANEDKEPEEDMVSEFTKAVRILVKVTADDYDFEITDEQVNKVADNLVNNDRAWETFDEELDAEFQALGKETVKESKKLKTESNNAKEELLNINVSTFQELKDEIERLLEEEIIDDDQYGTFMDLIDENESACEDYIERRSKVTNTDWKDELGIEADNVLATVQAIISEVSDLDESKSSKKEFLDVTPDINISTGDISTSSNLDLGGLGEIAGLLASEEKEKYNKKKTESEEEPSIFQVEGELEEILLHERVTMDSLKDLLKENGVEVTSLNEYEYDELGEDTLDLRLIGHIIYKGLGWDIELYYITTREDLMYITEVSVLEQYDESKKVTEEKSSTKSEVSNSMDNLYICTSDNQGGSFGEGIETVLGWKLRMASNAYGDDNYGELELLNNWAKEDGEEALINEIMETWDITLEKFDPNKDYSDCYFGYSKEDIDKYLKEAEKNIKENEELINQWVEEGLYSKNFDVKLDDEELDESKSKKTESKLNFINDVNELPDICYGILPSDCSIIVIKKGEKGYFETDEGYEEAYADIDNYDEKMKKAEEVCNKLNEKLGVTPDQRFTMELRSMSNNWSSRKDESCKNLNETVNMSTLTDTVDVINAIESVDVEISTMEDLERLRSIARSFAGSQGFYGRLLRDLAGVTEEDLPIIL